MPLTDVDCRNAKCDPGRAYQRHADAGGLYLEVSVTGARLWRWKYRFAGKEKRLALGQYPEVSLKAARQARDEARAMLQAGTDPGEAKRDAKRQLLAAQATAFKPVALEWWAGWSTNKTERYAANVLARLEADVFPVIGHKPVASLAASHFVQVAKRTEARGAAELARRVLQSCGLVMRWAVAHDLAERNPVADVKPGDVLKPRTVTNFARVGAGELPELLRKIAAYDGSVFTRVALQLMAHTFVRTSELIEARWQEFDLEAREWTVPADRVGRKGTAGKRRPHLVPLSRQALELLGILRVARGEDRCTGPALLFPGERDHERPMSNGTILMALKRMGYRGRMTGHGFRGVASTALNEMGYRWDVIEAQLSHVEGNRVRAAYNHAVYREERRAMMQGWSDYLDAVRQSGKVIPFHQARPKAAA